MTISKQLTYVNNSGLYQSQIHNNHLNRTCLNESEINRRSTFICRHILNHSVKKYFSTDLNSYTTRGLFFISVSSGFNGYSTLLSNISQNNLYSHTLLSASIVAHCVQKRFKGKKPTGETIEAIGKALEINIPKTTTINPNMGVNLVSTSADSVNNEPNSGFNASVEKKKCPTVQARKTDLEKAAIKKPFIEQPYSDPKTYMVPADKDEDKRSVKDIIKFDIKPKHLSIEKSEDYLEKFNCLKQHQVIDISVQNGTIKYDNTPHGDKKGREKITKHGHSNHKKVKELKPTTLEEAPAEMEPEYKVVLVKIHEHTVVPDGIQTHLVCLVKDNIAIGYFTGDKHGTEFISDKKFDNVDSSKEGPPQQMAVFKKPYVIPKEYMYETENTKKVTDIINKDQNILDILKAIKSRFKLKEGFIYDAKGLTKEDLAKINFLIEDLNHKPVSHNDKNYNKSKSLLDKVLGNVSFKKDNVNNHKAKTDKDDDDFES